MAWRVCLDCHTLIPAGTRDGRCDQHRREKDKTRGSAAARGYGTEHQELRANYQRRMDAGETYTCWRPGCGEPIDSQHWRLGHCDVNRDRYHGPECVACNQATAGRVGCPHPSHS